MINYYIFIKHIIYLSNDCCGSGGNATQKLEMVFLGKKKQVHDSSSSSRKANQSQTGVQESSAPLIGLCAHLKYDETQSESVEVKASFREQQQHVRKMQRGC